MRRMQAYPANERHMRVSTFVLVAIALVLTVAISVLASVLATQYVVNAEAEQLAKQLQATQHAASRMIFALSEMLGVR